MADDDTAPTRTTTADEFPDRLDVENRLPVRRSEVATKTTTRGGIVDDTRSERKTTQGVKHPGLTRLRECLKLIALANPPGFFKVDVKPRYLIIRSMESRRGEEYTKGKEVSAESVSSRVHE